MKREIKFRAWDGEKMHYDVCPWQWDFVISRAWHRCEKSTGAGLFGSGGDTGEFLVPGVRFKELMQFTGLKDKNGKEIYEEDIVRLTNSKSQIQKKSIISEIGFIDGAFCALWRNTEEWEGYNVSPSSVSFLNSIEQPFIEIIGNIYENPDLLSA